MSSDRATPPTLAESFKQALERDDAYHATLSAASTAPLGKLGALASSFSAARNDLAQSIADADRLQVEAAARAHLEHAELQRALEQNLQSTDARFRQLRAQIPLLQRHRWIAEEWAEYDAARQRNEFQELPRTLCAGEAGMGERWRTPFYLPFADLTGPLVITSETPEGRSAAHAVLENLVWRLALTLPGQVAFHFVDPNNSGNVFLRLNRLPGRIESTGELYRDLVQVENAFKRITSNYLSGSVTRFADIDPRQRRREKVNVVVIADYPRGFENEPRCQEVLRRIGDNGTIGGAYVLMHKDLTAPEPRTGSAIEFKAPLLANRYVGQFLPKGVSAFWSDRPSPELSSKLAGKLGEAGVDDRGKLGFEEVVAVSNTALWQESSAECISTPVGSRGGDPDALRILFGTNERGQQIPHGVVAAATGQGKSNFFHVLILGLAERYSPDELRFYLVDGKDGVELQPYKDLPHAEVVSLNTAPQLARSVLAELIQEMSRRNALFRKLNVKEYPDYRKLCAENPNLEKLPRLLLLVDEYQILFDGDGKEAASNALADLSRTSRSVGIHMLLGSQRFGAKDMTRRDEIFSQMALRVAMKMAQSEVATLTEFQREGKDAINALDGLGKVVINEYSGQDGHNRQGIVAHLEKNKELGRRIRRLVEQAAQSGIERARTVVFAGGDQPHLREIPGLAELAQNAQPPTAQELQAFATRPSEERGGGVNEWYPSYQPRLGWLGQEFSVHGYATVVLRRENANHLLIAGGNDNARHGMLLSLLTGFALNLGATGTEFILIDRTGRGTPWEQVAPSWIQHVARPGGFACRHAVDSGDTDAALSAAAAELKRRQGLDDDARLRAPSVIVVLIEPDRIDSLRRPAERYADDTPTPAKDALQALLRDGPNFGIHLVVSAAGKHALETSFDLRRSLRQIRLRVLLQMSDDESAELGVQHRAAALNTQGETPVVALLVDNAKPNPTVFKPCVFLPPKGSEDRETGAGDELKTFTETVKRWAQTRSTP